MKLILEDCHFEALERSGYINYGNAQFSFIKSIDPNNVFEEKLRKNAYFHAIVDYYNREISLHIDIPHPHNKPGHRTKQSCKKIEKECERIRKTTFSYKLEVIKQKYFNKLDNYLCQN